MPRKRHRSVPTGKFGRPKQRAARIGSTTALANHIRHQMQLSGRHIVHRKTSHTKRRKK